MLVSKQNIQSLLPQRPPMVMVDELLFTNETITRCRFKVEADNIFTESGVFCEPGLVENIAQTAAAGVGYTAARQTKKTVPLGYIGAIKDLEIFLLPKVGDSIETEIEIINRVFDVTLVSGIIYCNNELAAKCEMKIFITKPS
jgi:predicted hotdog family 3-hydroxylacyl-ACP dehydratase